MWRYRFWLLSFMPAGMHVSMKTLVYQWFSVGDTPSFGLAPTCSASNKGQQRHCSCNAGAHPSLYHAPGRYELGPTTPAIYILWGVASCHAPLGCNKLQSFLQSQDVCCRFQGMPRPTRPFAEAICCQILSMTGCPVLLKSCCTMCTCKKTSQNTSKPATCLPLIAAVKQTE